MLRKFQFLGLCKKCCAIFFTPQPPPPQSMVRHRVNAVDVVFSFMVFAMRCSVHGALTGHLAIHLRMGVSVDVVGHVD